MNQVGLLIHCCITFDQYYPYRAPQIKFSNKKGLDEEQYDEIMEKMTNE